MQTHVRVHGDPTGRGQQYGQAVRPIIERAVASYRRSFSQLFGWDWPEVCARADPYRPPIGEFNTRYLDELDGIARGAGLSPRDILALNVRTELLAAGYAERGDPNLTGECTASGHLPSHTTERHTLLAQNWDWRLHAAGTVVVLESEQDDGPNFVTIVEAGLIAKCGMNAFGVGVVTNALATTDDRGDPGVPYHVLLRAMLDSETASDTLATLLAHRRASSANFIVAQHGGIVIDLETAPGDDTSVCLIHPRGGSVVHANHFIGDRMRGHDLGLIALPHSPFRAERMRQLLDVDRGRVSVQVLMQALADHANHPLGICCHPDHRMPEPEQGATLASLIMDLDKRRMWLSDGNPCASPYRELHYGAFLASPTRSSAK